MIDPDTLYRAPNALAQHYSRFRVTERIMLTGHSHQAWPDCGMDAQQQAWLDAAELADDKWERAFEKADRVRRGFAKLLNDSTGDYALGASTHEMVIRFLSALPLRQKLVTTDSEFHTIRRQLDRLGEEGLEIIKVPQRPLNTLAERLAEAVDENVAAVLVSWVFFTNGHIAPGLGHVAQRCDQAGTALLVDAYHALNVLPVSLREEGLESAFVVGGGYKYCQLGEGNCFLRIPKDCNLRPTVTGWFSEFEELAARGSETRVVYGKGAARFAGATYDPTSHYRAASVFEFFDDQQLMPQLLREVSQHQITHLARLFDEMDADPKVIARDEVPLEQIAGFLPLKSPRAATLSKTLRMRGVLTDYRGDVLRLGPAPYLSDEQLTAAMHALRDVLQLKSGRSRSRG